MSRITRRFREIRRKQRKAFIPYIMAGHPHITRTKEMVGILEDSGADIIELGVPFSDPLADGPTIQKAAQKALEGGITLHSVIEFVDGIRKGTQIPIVLMTYYNPVFQYGVERFVSDASSAGVDGVIVPDLPPDEADDLIHVSRGAGFDTVFLLTPTSNRERMRKVARASSGFIYYVSITGITGAKLILDDAIAPHIAEIRESSNKPIAVGFGISTPEEASLVSRFADGVIIGSAIVKRVENPDNDLKEYLASLRKSII